VVTSGWLRPKYSGPAMAVLGGGGRSSPARRRASISALMRFSTCRHATRFRVEPQDIEGDSKDKRLWLGTMLQMGSFTTVGRPAEPQLTLRVAACERQEVEQGRK